MEEYELQEEGSIITQVVKSSSEQEKKTESTGNAQQAEAQSQGVQDYTSLSKQQEAPNQGDWGAVGQAIGSLFGALFGGSQEGETPNQRAQRLSEFEPPQPRQTDSGYVSQLDRIMMDQGPGQPGQSGATGSFSSSVDENVAKGSPRSENPLLNLLGQTEGTDRGRGYNETLGYGKFTGGDVDLQNMSVSDVRNLQRAMLRHPENKWNSSAVGRYQIVGTTMDSLIKEMGLTGSEKFDSKLQDAMVMKLMQRRGYDDFMSGKISAGQFQNNLAQEWASIPTTSGRGFYGNQSRTPKSGNQVTQILADLKSGKVTPQEAKQSGQVNPAYANIPDVDSEGRPGQLQKFMEWNSDPVGNEAKNLSEIRPEMSSVYSEAKRLAARDGLNIVLGSGKRTKEQQKKAIEWGWSKQEDSGHLTGDGMDIWVLDDNGAVDFDNKKLKKMRQYVREAAKNQGVELEDDISWDLPDFKFKSKK